MKDPIVYLEDILEAISKIRRYTQGLRALGDFTEDSDWDLLILIDSVLNDKRIDHIRHNLYEIEWDGVM